MNNKKDQEANAEIEFNITKDATNDEIMAEGGAKGM